jgi:hypothetical protein
MPCISLLTIITKLSIIIIIVSSFFSLNICKWDFYYFAVYFSPRLPFRTRSFARSHFTKIKHLFSFIFSTYTLLYSGFHFFLFSYALFLFAQHHQLAVSMNAFSPHTNSTHTKRQKTFARSRHLRSFPFCEHKIHFLCIDFICLLLLSSSHHRITLLLGITFGAGLFNASCVFLSVLCVLCG